MHVALTSRQSMLRSVLLSNFLILPASHFALGTTWKVGQTGVVFLPLSPGGSDGKASVYNVVGLGSIPGSGRSPGEGNGNPLQYYCLENSMDEGAGWGQHD